MEERGSESKLVTYTKKALIILVFFAQASLYIYAQTFLFTDDMELCKDTVLPNSIGVLHSAAFFLCVPFYLAIFIILVVTVYCILVSLSSCICPNAAKYMILCCYAKN